MAAPIAWLFSEFGSRRYLRITLGVFAIASSLGVAYAFGVSLQSHYNASYGNATRELVETAVHQIEDGNVDRVVSVLRRIKLDYHPTYRGRANYGEIVREAVQQLKSGEALADGKWTPSPFDRRSWIGHWENDTGYWIVINHGASGNDFDIRRSGDNVPPMSNVAVSDDFHTLKFEESDQWLHELEIVNKYEAWHVWKDAKTGQAWKSEPLHKLIRSTPAQRAFTQQPPAK